MVSQLQVWERRDRWSANCKCGTGEIVSQLQVWERDRWSANCKCGRETDGQPTASVGEER